MSEAEDSLARLGSALTGARVERVTLEDQGFELKGSVLLDWTGSPGAATMPTTARLVIGLFGDYEAFFQDQERPFAFGQEDKILGGEDVRIGVLIRVANPIEFAGLVGGPDLTPERLRDGLIRLQEPAETSGISGLRVSALSIEEEHIYFELTAEMTDPAALVRAARNSYNEAWWDDSWVPASFQEALFELVLGSNANPSPDALGFEICDYPKTRDEVRCALQADLAVQENPDLVPDRKVHFVHWMIQTGLDDSFVGDGREIPGTRDIYQAALRAVRNEPGPEPE